MTLDTMDYWFYEWLIIAKGITYSEWLTMSDKERLNMQSQFIEFYRGI